MASSKYSARTKELFLGPVMGALLGIISGLFFFLFPIGQSLTTSSFDIPFCISLKGSPDTSDAVIVYMDETSYNELKQDYKHPWDRRLHANLVHRLTRDGAKAVFFDIIFSDPADDIEVDEDFAMSLKRQGFSFIGADFVDTQQADVSGVKIIKPAESLRKAAKAWGDLRLQPVDKDFGVRHMWCGDEDRPSLPWQIADEMGSAFTKDENNRLRKKYYNYVGPAGSIPNISYWRALQYDGVPKDFFKDKVVFIGVRPQTAASADAGKDSFRNAYMLVGGDFVPGVELHATSYLNLMRGNWMERLPEGMELGLIIGLGILLGVVLNLVRPLLVGISIVPLGVAIVAGGWSLHYFEHLWFAFLIPVLVQLPTVSAWSIVNQYVREGLKRRKAMQALSVYLSPEMAKQIAEKGDDVLAPGGKLVEATVMFTDLEGFTSFSERLPPDQVSNILIEYFTQTTGSILNHKGTIIKYIGDAVLATWGAPVADDQQAFNAVEAGLELIKNSRIMVEGVSLRTRIGVHTGLTLAGNLGSAQRVDYTVIGDTVNTAARLEGLNKYLGTNLLISEETYSRLHNKITTRPMGKLLLKGKSKPLGIHELIEQEDKESEWLKYFNEALQLFERGRYQQAIETFEIVKQKRTGGDAPSDFYIHYIEELIEHLQDPTFKNDWPGVVVLKEK